MRRAEENDLVKQPRGGVKKRAGPLWVREMRRDMPVFVGCAWILTAS